jgi:hypothetical protein
MAASDCMSSNSFRLALHLLGMQCMTLTIDDVLQCEERLQAEIVERECVLAAIKVLKEHAHKGRCLTGLDSGVLGWALQRSPATKTLLLEATAEPAVPEPSPAPPRPKPYIHPELEPLSHGRYGTDTRVVSWAIGRMTENFTLKDISKLLKREGNPMHNAKISVVLTRLKRNGRIQEIECGRGPNASVFRKPESSFNSPVPAADSISGSEETPVSEAA